MPHYIYSTHTNSTDYVEWSKTANEGFNTVVKRFSVKGGHGICNKHMLTPEGVATRVDSDADMEWLESLPAFQADIKKGFIRVSKRKEETEKIVRRDMQLRDGSAPIVPTDYKPSESGRFTYTKPTNAGSIML